MRCERCDGLMVTDHYIDMEGAGPGLKAWRYICCENVVNHEIKAHHSSANNTSASGVPVNFSRKGNFNRRFGCECPVLRGLQDARS